MTRLSSPQMTWWPPGPPGVARFLARTFGSRHTDLDVDFARPRQEVISALLQLCILSPVRDRLTVDEIWSWSVAERLQALLAIATASRGEELTALTRCGHAACARQIELDLLLTSFAALIPPVASSSWTTDSGERVTVRVPTGDDLRSWPALAGRSRPDAATALAGRLIAAIDDRAPGTEWTFPPGWLEGVERSLAEADPLTALQLSVVCPHCDEAIEVEVDLEALVLSCLAQCQRRSLRDIHFLASAYHWSEADIVRLPVWRRDHYLQRLEAEGLR